MPSLTVTSKGQVTLRKEVLKHLGVSPGDKVTVELEPDGHASIKAEKSGNSIEKLFGLLKKTGEKPLTLKQIDEIIAKGWAGRR
jgi:AbrB family looped-hinge helix DNA binding protein